MRIPRSASAVVSALAASILLAGCVPQPERTSTPTGEHVAPQYERYYSQVLTWKDCGSEMQCTTATAPLDWSAPDPAADIELALVRHPASGSKKGSLFVNPGGPGASGFDFVHDSLDFAVDDKLQKSFDVIGWDPRGVGRSTAVDCYDGPQLDRFLFGMPDAPVDSPQYVKEVTTEAKDFADACEKRTGRLLEFVDTESTVQDLDMLRALVGEPKLDYLGYSYGSDIGSRYADRFPDHVGRMVLDGATDSSLSLFDVELAQTKAFGNALRDYLADCLAGSDCPFTGTVDDAIGQVRKVLDRADEAPLRGKDGRRLTSAYLTTAIQFSLYDQGSWPYLTKAFQEVREGVPDTAFLLADLYVDRNEDGTYSSNLNEAFLAITCVDYPVERDPAVLAKERDAIAEADPLAEPEDLDTLGDIVCQQWPYQFRGKLEPVSADGAAPIVVVGTTGDPATPYPWAQALADQLESGVLLTYVGEGHIAYDEGDPCIVDAVDSYLVDGTVPKDGLVCDPAKDGAR